MMDVLGNELSDYVDDKIGRIRTDEQSEQSSLNVIIIWFQYGGYGNLDKNMKYRFGQWIWSSLFFMIILHWKRIHRS